jgi:phosphoribosylformylglycinamidine synthase PurS subunit
MLARVSVTLKSGVLDPQGKAIEGALHSLGLDEIGSVRQGKMFEIEVNAHDRADAMDILQRACERLLANTVIENYAIEILEGSVA